MNLYRGAFFVLLVVTLFSIGCGSNKFNPNNVIVTVTPATAMASVNGQLTLQAAIQNDCTGCVPLYVWYVAENNGGDCTWIDTPPAGPCPAGTIQQNPDVGVFTVTYFAPATSGTYHVTAQWNDYDNFSGPPVATKLGVAAVTITP